MFPCKHSSFPLRASGMAVAPAKLIAKDIGWLLSGNIRIEGPRSDVLEFMIDAAEPQCAPDRHPIHGCVEADPWRPGGAISASRSFA